MSYIVRKPNYDNQWSTKWCQCSGYENCFGDWCCALFAGPISAALTRERVDGTPCCFALCTAAPCYHINVVRHRYNIQGSDCGDVCGAMFCMPCVLRQAATESRQRGRIPAVGPLVFNDGGAKWNQGMCSGKCSHCCAAHLCLPMYMAYGRSNFDGSAVCLNCMFQCPAAFPNMIRHAYGIEGGECGDFCRAAFCAPCANVQAFNEVTAGLLNAPAAMVKQVKSAAGV